MRGHVEIAGAGISGLTAAVALAQRGWSVRLHERAPALRLEGAGIALNKNTQRTMHAIGALEPTIEGLQPFKRFETRDGRGNVIGARDHTIHDRLLTELEGEHEGSTPRFPESIAPLGWWPSPVYFVERGKLLLTLHRLAVEAGAEVVTNSEVVSASTDGTVTLGDGSQHKADLVVGADGIYSRVRESVGFGGTKKRLPYGATLTRARGIPKPDDFKNGVVGEYWADKRTRHLFFATLSPESTYFAFMTATIDAEQNGTPLRIGDDGRPNLIELHVGSWIKSFPSLKHVLSDLEMPPIWSPFVEVHLPQWHRGRVVLIGDAAHAMAPAMGMGGTTAMMDAVSLSENVGRTSDHEADLRLWEYVNRPFIDWVQRRSRFWGNVGYSPRPVRKAILVWAIQHSAWVRKHRFAHTDFVSPDVIKAAETRFSNLAG